MIQATIWTAGGVKEELEYRSAKHEDMPGKSLTVPVQGTDPRRDILALYRN